jgi:lycopene cyclase domain-containing protein
LVWALPAIIFQLAFGADIIWRQWRLIFLAVVPMTLYLSLADAIAIGSGIWTISPAKSTGILLGGVLPLEEFVFFLLTNTLVAFGFVLFWSPESYARAKGILSKIRSESQEGKLQQEL